MPATSIDEVLTQLQTIITSCEKNGDRTGYFAALYYKVTSRVKEGIAAGEFEDGPRMARLDVLFANRYLDALDQWRHNMPLTDSWKVALDATKQSPLLVLQHLLLGINAHINLDLGIAAVEAIQNQNIGDIHQDFNTINSIIGSLVYEVIHEINRISPLLSLLGLHANQTDSILIQFSIGNARDGAWCFAEDLSKKSGGLRDACLAERDKEIAKLAAALGRSSGFIRLTVWIIHLFELKDPAKIIKILVGYKKTFIHASRVK